MDTSSSYQMLPQSQTLVMQDVKTGVGYRIPRSVSTPDLIVSVHCVCVRMFVIIFPFYNMVNEMKT